MQHEITEELLAALSEIFAKPDSIQSEEDLQSFSRSGLKQLALLHGIG